MKMPNEGYLLRVFIGESDKWQGKPLYEALVLKARELHLAGATVLRGPRALGRTADFTRTRFCGYPRRRLTSSYRTSTK